MFSRLREHWQCLFEANFGVLLYVSIDRKIPPD